METIWSLLQIFLDAGLLLLCLEKMFQDENHSAGKRKYGIYPVLVIFCMGARVNYIAGGEARELFLVNGYEIAPADNIYLLLFLMLGVAVTGSLAYQSSDNGYTLCGSIGVFSVYLTSRVISVFLFLLCGAEGNTLLLGSRILSFLLAGIFLFSPVFAWCRQVLRDGGFAARLGFANITLLLSVFLFLFSFDIGELKERPGIIALLLFCLILSDGVLLVYNGHKIQEQKRVRMIEQYVPVVEELVSQVRSRQHEFNNRMIAIEAAVFSAGSLEEARQSVSRLTEGIYLEANDRELLSCDSKIIAGILYEKIRQASLLHIEILVELQSEFRKSPLPETEWAEIIGILLDNAVEASKGGDQIHVRFRKTGHSVELTVANPFPPMSNTEFMRLFGKGVTTKQRESGMHGYGLYNVLSVMERFHGKIITRNETGNDRNYVVFGVKMELHAE